MTDACRTTSPTGKPTSTTWTRTTESSNHDTVSQLNGFACDPGDLPSFEPGGRRRRIYQPSRALAAR